jgi:hypothetical protein
LVKRDQLSRSADRSELPDGPADRHSGGLFIAHVKFGGEYLTRKTGHQSFDRAGVPRGCRYEVSVFQSCFEPGDQVAVSR